MIDTSETKFPYKLLLTERRITNVHKTFLNRSSADINLSRPQISKMRSCVFLVL